MNITFTKEELAAFDDTLQNWHAKKTDFICTSIMQHAREEFRRVSNPQNILMHLSDEFEKDNPKPDWRSLL